MVAIVLVGCATQAEREAARLGAVARQGAMALEACAAQAKASPEYQLLRDVIPSADDGVPTPAQQANTSKATPEQVEAIYAYHQDYLLPCRRIAVETSSRISAGLVAALAERFTRTDAALILLTDRLITFGAFNQAWNEARIEFNYRLDVILAAVERDLQYRHEAEIRRRAQAVEALAAWAQAQQAIDRHQRRLNAISKSRLTTCQYVGTQLVCTTF